MAISSNWSNLRSFLRRVHNKEVNQWFRDVNDPTPDNTTPRGNAKRACTILATESQNMALLKVLNFRYNIQRVHLRPNVYGLPISSDQPVRRHRPQIVLEFLEDAEDTDPDFDPIDGRISYRLMNETSESITKAELTQFANRISAQFGGGNGFVWRKGKDMATYTDKENGYQFQLLVRNISDARTIISRVLATNNDTPNFRYLNYKENDRPTERFPTLPPLQNVLGRSIREPRQRPIAEVRFKHAYATIWGITQPVPLVDLGFTFFDAIVRR